MERHFLTKYMPFTVMASTMFPGLPKVVPGLVVKTLSNCQQVFLQWPISFPIRQTNIDQWQSTSNQPAVYYIVVYIYMYMLFYNIWILRRWYDSLVLWSDIVVPATATGHGPQHVFCVGVWSAHHCHAPSKRARQKHTRQFRSCGGHQMAIQY